MKAGGRKRVSRGKEEEEEEEEKKKQMEEEAYNGKVTSSCHQIWKL